ncbi:MAG: hypothetical protein SOW59_09240 [Corynebacterium sp.]|nr:hypothetical protein [Corynebacterium sp.]
MKPVHGEPLDDFSEVLAYAEDDASMAYLYDFFTQDLAARVEKEREFIPPGFEDLLGDDSVLDYVWLWIKDPGANGFRQYLRDGEFSEAEVNAAFIAKREEWGMNTPPHLEWLKDDGFDESTLSVAQDMVEDK